MKLLLLSNSTNVNESFLSYSQSNIISFLGNNHLNILFIPYAAVTLSYDDYEKKVKEKFEQFGYQLTSIHHYKSQIDAIESTEAIVVGGGNTFHLLKNLQDKFLLKPIINRIMAGIPYLGWSAGANLASPTIATTNDMPIVEIMGFKSLNLVPFQINPHYSNFVQPKHGGETRDQRILEYLTANPEKIVLGLPEGCMLNLENDRLHFIGQKSLKIFRVNELPLEYDNDSDISFLLNN